MIAVLAAMLLPADGGPRKARRISCANNLKQIGESFRVWSLEHDDKLPMQVSTNKDGTLEFVQSGSAVVHFLALSNYGVEVRWLICPSDEPRCSWHWPKSISNVTDTNVSYFVGLDATLGNPKSILAGDRNWGVNNMPAKPGLLVLTTKSYVGWTDGLHFSNSISGSGGNILSVDGHVEFIKSKELNAGFHDQGLATNHFAIP